MVGPVRVGGKKLSLTIGGVELHLEATSATMDNEEASSDVATFADAEAGGARQHFLNVSSIQSTEVASFWRYVWAHSGETAAFVLRPHGNEVASADEPHFSGTLTIGPKPTLGGDAGAKKDQTFTTRMDIDGEPVLDDGANAKPVVVSVSDDTPAVGDSVQVNGSRFTGTTGVTIDALAAKFTVVTDGIIVVVVPATAAGAAALIITNPDGASDPFALTV